MRLEKGLVGMGDLVEPANLGVEVTAQQELGSDLGSRIRNQSRSLTVGLLVKNSKGDQIR